MKKTFFYDTHAALGAKIGAFGGYAMPIQYEGIIKEHFSTRRGASLFDTCHMGEFMIEGTTACADLDAILSCNVSELKIGRCKYGFLCNPAGGVLDDQLIYRLSDTSFFMVVNASTKDADFAWLLQHCSPSTTARNCSEETAKIDIQGPLCVKIVQKLIDEPITYMLYYSFMRATYKGANILISRTGYTGEIGFELYLDASRAKSFWDESMELGAKPAGLGARDTLRLEMGFPLYGHELDERRNAAESGFSRAISPMKKFIGSEAVRDPANVRRILSGISLFDRRAARQGDVIVDARGNVIGAVTSGSYAPSLGHAIAMGYVDREARTAVASVMIRNERYELPGEITEMPFYKNATARKQLTDFI
jgi:aminomethyltransferase